MSYHCPGNLTNSTRLTNGLKTAPNKKSTVSAFMPRMMSRLSPVHSVRFNQLTPVIPVISEPLEDLPCSTRSRFNGGGTAPSRTSAPWPLESKLQPSLRGGGSGRSSPASTMRRRSATLRHATTPASPSRQTPVHDLIPPSPDLGIAALRPFSVRHRIDTA